MDRMSDVARYAEEIRTIVCEALLIPRDELTASTLFDDIGLTSRQRIQLLARVEVHFEVTVDLDELDRLTDVNGVAEVIAEALAARHTTG